MTKSIQISDRKLLDALAQVFISYVKSAHSFTSPPTPRFTFTLPPLHSLPYPLEEKPHFPFPGNRRKALARLSKSQCWLI